MEMEMTMSFVSLTLSFDTRIYCRVHLIHRPNRGLMQSPPLSIPISKPAMTSLVQWMLLAHLQPMMMEMGMVMASSSCYSSSFDDVLSREHWCVLRRNVTPYYALNGVFNHVADLALNTAGWKLCDVQNNIQSFEKMEMAMGMVKSVACVHAPIELVASLLGMNHHHHHRHQYHHHHYPFSEYVESHQLGPKLYEV